MMERCHGEAASWGVVDNESGVVCRDFLAKKSDGKCCEFEISQWQ